MPGPEKPEASRIAIKLGAPASSGSATRASRPLLSSLGKRPRPSHGLGGHFDSESEDESHANGRHERIIAFGDNGAELQTSSRGRRRDNDHAKRGPLSIERQPNRDWRTEARARNGHGKRQSEPAGMRGEKAGKDVDPAADAGATPMKWGLTITRNDSHESATSNQNEAAGETKGDREHAPEEAQALGAPGDGADDENSTEKEAVMALLGQRTSDRTKTERIIDREANKVTEDDAFEKDFRNAPDVSTLEDYEEMPVEEFGAALLRGMGWDGKDKGPKVKQVVRRPNQMGLGAKELKGAEDLGGWNNKTGASSSHKQRPPRLHDYRREEEKRKEKRGERYRDSYKAERDRERDRDRDDRRGSSYHGSSGSSSRHRGRHER